MDRARRPVRVGILAAFLRTARGHHGTIVLGRPAGAEPFTAADRRLLASVAGQAAVAIERAGLQRQVADRRALDQELAIGRRIQISLMPRRFPRLAGWEIASAYEPAREVGGDFYDVFRLRDRGGCIGLVVADVTGKGIPAAILMADARGPDPRRRRPRRRSRRHPGPGQPDPRQRTGQRPVRHRRPRRASTPRPAGSSWRAPATTPSTSCGPTAGSRSWSRPAA